MGKRKWKRIKLEDLAEPEEQNRILELLDQVRQPAPDSPEKQGHETAQAGR